MGTLKAPLFSLGARNSIGKALTFFPWKGLDCVREYVIPANPNTTLQAAQRTHLKNAVDEFHASEYTSLDQTAWNRFAGTLAKIMTGFNAMIRAHVKEAILGNTWERISDGETFDVAADTFNVRVAKEAAGNVPTVHYGTSKTFMPNTRAMVDQGDGTWEVDIPSLSSDALYYFYIDVGASETDYGRTGIYQQRTS